MDVVLAVSGSQSFNLSTDAGVSWVEKTHPKPGFLGKNAYGNGVWLYVQANEPANVAYVSIDLEAWALVTLPATQTWTLLKFMLGAFYLFSGSASYYRSADGEAWTAHTAPVASTVYSLVAASPGLIMLVESDNSVTSNVYTTSDGASWALAGTHTVPASATRKGLHWTGTSFSIHQSGGASATLDKSSDGVAWSYNALAYGRSYYGADSIIGCAAQGGGASALVFAGESVTPATGTAPTGGVVTALHVIAGRIFIASGSSIIYSDDGSAWITPSTSFAANLTEVIGGVLPDAPNLRDTLTLLGVLDGTILVSASTVDQLTFSSTLTLTLLVAETYFDGLMLSDLLQSSQALTAELSSVLRIGTDVGGVLAVEGGRVVLGEPIQYGVNAASGALTRYQGFGFAGYARCGQTLYGAKTDGLYRIRPGSDNGEPVQVQIDLGDTDFGTALGKTIESVYLGIATDGEAYVRLKAGDADYTYRAIQKGEMARAVTGKGLAGRRWAISLEIADATQLTLDMVEVRLAASGRRLRARN